MSTKVNAEDCEIEGLLAAIRASPDDDAPRAVYADLLMRRGDPRGEIVALQLADARGELGDKARTRMRGLVRKHLRALLGDLGPLVGFTLMDAEGNGRVAFRRGFLAQCALPHGPKALRALVGRPELATVEHLDLPGRKDALRVAEHPVLRALRRLTVETLPVPFPASLAQRVEALTVRDVDGSLEEVLTGCASLPRLRTLRVTHFGEDESASFLPALARLLGVAGLEALCLQISDGRIEVDRPARRVTLTTRLGARPVPDLVACCRDIPIDTVVVDSDHYLRGMAPNQTRVVEPVHRAALARIEQAMATHLPGARLEVRAEIDDP